MEQRQFDRFKDAPWFKVQEEVVMVGGAGGISSWVTLLLNRAGFVPMVYDFDTVEAHNLGGQLFRKIDIGTSKVTALYNIINEFCEEQISVFNAKIDENSPTNPFMICGFDNMEARKVMFNNWKKSIATSLVQPLFIDGRLEMENLQIFCVTPENMDKYEEEHLFSDEELEDAPCTMRQTSHSATMIASHMVAFFTNHITNVYEREVVRDVPFFYEYFIPMNLTVST